MIRPVFRNTTPTLGDWREESEQKEGAWLLQDPGRDNAGLNLGSGSRKGGSRWFQEFFRQWSAGLSLRMNVEVEGEGGSKSRQPGLFAH